MREHSETTMRDDDQDDKKLNDSYICHDPTEWVDVSNTRFSFTYQYKNIPPLNIQKAVHFAACTFSGPIALAYEKDNLTWNVTIRTCSGRVLKDSLEVPDAFSIEWTRGHCLFVLDRRGHATVYSSLGERVSEIYFSNAIKEVRSSRMFTTSRQDSGCAIIDDEYRVFVINSVSEPIVWSMNSPMKENPTAWTTYQPYSQLTHVLLIYGSQFYLGLQGEQLTIQTQITNWAESKRIYIQCVVDDTRSRIALLNDESTIQIVSIDLEQLFSTIKLNSPIPDCKFGWLSSTALFAQISPTKLLLINAREGADEFSDRTYEKITGFSRIAIEPDGIRSIQNCSVEFISTATREQKSVLGVASSEDGALLYESARYLGGCQSHLAFEYASQVHDMNKAIDDCISTACDSWEPKMQKKMLMAAKFGMAFTNSAYDSSKMHKAIQDLRVINELHASRTGIPLTHRQLKTIGETCLINRLIDMGSYCVAIKIAQWLYGETSEHLDRVLLEWVRRIIKNVVNNEQKYDRMAIEALERKISNKLLTFPHISISDVAKRAIAANLPQLARLFIKRETDDSNHVSILLQLDDVGAALERAAASQRPQLMHQVILHLMSTQRRPDYELTISKIPLAQVLYRDLIRQEGDNMPSSGRQMLSLLEQASDFERQTLYHFDVADTETNPSERLFALRRAKDAAKNLGDKSIEEVLNEVTAFAPLQIEKNQANMPIRETIIDIAHDSAKIQQLKGQAKLNDKQVYLWTIEGLAKKGKMEQLFDMAQKKSPIGYAPFIKACVKYKRFDEVKKYMPKLVGYNDLVAANISLKNYVEAAKLAFDRRDREMVHSIFLKSQEDRVQYEKCATIWKSL